VRTNFAGGISRAELRKERGSEAVQELNRAGALTGAADTSGKKQDVYFCHDYCELGALPSSQVFHDIDDFLSRNLTDVVVMDVEDYVKPKDLKKAMVDAGLFRRVWRPDPKELGWPSLLEMVRPKKGQDENPRRLVVMSEKHEQTPPWLISTYQVSGETPFAFKSASEFNCQPKRGGTDKSFLIVNHWVQGGIPDPIATAKVNSQKTLTTRLQQCITDRQQIPNAIGVNFTSQGDLFKTVRRFNAAIARQSGVTAMVSKTIDQLRAVDDITDAQERELDGLHRLPQISEADARKLLGPLSDRIPTPPALKEYASPCPDGTHAATNADIKAGRDTNGCVSN
jgi:hypothetical protein